MALIHVPVTGPPSVNGTALNNAIKNSNPSDIIQSDERLDANHLLAGSPKAMPVIPLT